MAPFSKPETVLKQAEGLVSVGQSHAALQSLTEMFSSKRFRSTPLSSLEPIMLRFVELCVDMRKGRTAKEGLMQYKNIAQNTNVNSIEVVIQKFVNLADAKVREAQAKASAAAGSGLGDVDDLEATETPESILLGAVSGDQSKDRTDRALVTPWLKFLWESYRTALETLKNNARLEMIYQNIAQQAFKFCLTHSRKVEFRRLCETLRLHLSNTAKYSHQTHSINLQDPETLQHHLDTRFAQLNTSVELELWQEAFRSVEDVHNLLMMAKGKDKGLGVGGGLRPSMMAGYYEKLTRIFLMSGNALYHAAAWGRYYSIILSSSGQAAGGGVAGKSEEEMEKLAGQVLVSALAVPVGLLGEEGGEGGEAKGRGGRLTALLGLSKAPTRSGLLRDALSRNVLKLAPQPIKQLYNILEVSFDPLNLCTTITPLLKSLSSDPSYSSYLPLIQRAVLSRLLQQLSQVYETVEIKQLLDLVKPLLELGVKTVDGEEVKGVVGVAGVIKDEIQVEAYVMGCARRGELNVKIDHANGSITFVDDAFSSGSGVFAADNEPSTSTSGAARESAIQASTSELVRTRLSKIATALHNTLLTISPPPTPSPEEVQARLATLITAANSERKALQIRRALVARRRELLSELSARKEKEESSRKADAARKEKEEEARRQLQEVKKREMERTKKEIENIRVEEAKKLAESLKAKGRLTVDIDDMENLSTDNLMRLQVEQIEKEKRELNERLRIISKRVDHVERAFRKEERPLLAQDYESQQANDRATFDALQKARIEGAKITHEHNLETKQRLARMMEDYKARREVILAKRGEEFRKKQEKAQRKIAEEKAKRKAAVLKEREEERHRSEEEEKQRREEEEEKARKEAGLLHTPLLNLQRLIFFLF
ncbi:hypothetical protein JAAARDRAFT_256306 [Jaapia argillacea MUCL 33604]|uniref:Eukaryotic translation initiation factor 3 subunit A n=1 Tax=Jaapia argillacea MUCL 33604 TaxID=933084 RepID=A0A067Q634_9AGAM|nr:hypothetical protein JAAARDRAFT_256306 [Jaapia argillacea MUCL 33604]